MHGVGAADDGPEVVRRTCLADMGVGDIHDAETVERIRQTGDRNLHGLDLRRRHGAVFAPRRQKTGKDQDDRDTVFLVRNAAFFEVHDEKDHVPQEEERGRENEHARTPCDQKKRDPRQDPGEDHELNRYREKEQAQRDNGAVFSFDGQRQPDAARRISDGQKEQSDPKHERLRMLVKQKTAAE